MRGISVVAMCLAVLAAAIAEPATTSAGTHTASRHGAQATGAPYTGTAEVSYFALPRFDAPTAAAEYAAGHRVLSRFAVRDRSHFRVDVQTVSPALDSGTFTEVVNGSRATSYDARSGLAFRSTVPRQHRAALLDELLGTLQSGGMVSEEAVPQPDPTKPISVYLKLLRHPGLAPPGIHFRARIVGQDTMLNRPVDVIDYRPITIKVIGNTCSRTKHGTICRPSRFHGSGSARIWVDRNRPFVLRYQAHGTTKPHDVAASNGAFSYRVTSIVYGQGPSDQDLLLQPPVRVVAGAMLMSFMPFSEDNGPGPGVAPPGPFVYPGPPSTGALSVSNGIQRSGYGPHYTIASVTILFSTGKHGTVYFYKPLKLGPMPYVKGPYLLIQERLRPGGLPPELQTGAVQAAGRCQSWSAAFADGQQWLAFARGKAAVLVTTNALTSSQLADYVARDMCP